jgi:putative PIN family toxin of toxin-antitoxin system
LREPGRERARIKAVIDTSVFVAGVFWRGPARECLARFARREFEAVVSEAILQEYAETAWDLKIEEGFSLNPQPWLNWISNRATILAPVSVNEPVSPDPDDDKFIECALAAHAGYIVSRDNHLLRLNKPFGIAIVDDREFLAVLKND